jgi:hypothetical protein
MKQDFHPGSRIRIQGSKRHLISDPDLQHWCTEFSTGKSYKDFELRVENPLVNLLTNVLRRASIGRNYPL